MNYLKKIGRNAKIAFEDLKSIKHNKIVKVLDSYNISLLKNKKKILSCMDKFERCKKCET